MADQPNLPANVDTSNKDEFTAALMAAGFINPASGGADFHRVKLQGSNVVYNDDVIGVYNAKTKEPALIVQLVDAPTEYQSMWFETELAMAVGRPSIAGRFCKSHFEAPTEARKFAEDGTSCDTCPVHPFVPKDKLPPEAKAQQGADRCSWKADVEFRILDKQADGTFEGTDETIYTMSLSTTGIIEFKGSSSRKADQLAGSVSPENFMVQLAKLGMEKWGKDGLLKAHTALRLGGVIAELHIPMAKSDDGSRTWYVPSFKPVDILEIEENPALETTEETPPIDPEAEAAASSEDEVPF